MARNMEIPLPSEQHVLRGHLEVEGHSEGPPSARQRRVVLPALVAIAALLAVAGYAARRPVDIRGAMVPALSMKDAQFWSKIHGAKVSAQSMDEAPGVSSIYAGFAGKTYCSQLFISERTPEQVRAYDLAAVEEAIGSHLSSQNLDIDEDGQFVNMTVCDTDSVCATMTWQFYGPRFGCHLSGGFDPMDTPERILAESDFQMLDVPARSGAPHDTAPLPRDLSGDANGISREEWDSLISEAFNDSAYTGNFAVMAWIDGAVVAEGYAIEAGVNVSTPLPGGAMTMTLASMMLGLRVRDEKMNPMEPIWAPELSDDEVNARALTASRLMRMRVGKPLPEQYSGEMLWIMPDFAHFATVMSGPLQNRYTPQQPDFYYSSGSTEENSRAMRHTFDDDAAYWSELFNEVFLPIGASGMSIETDATGTLGLSDFGWGTAEDWLRLGILILNDGVWDGHRILPAGWVHMMRQPATWSDCHFPKIFYSYACWYRGGVWSRNKWVVSLYGVDGQLVEVNFGRKSVFVRMGTYGADGGARVISRLEDFMGHGDLQEEYACDETSCEFPVSHPASSPLGEL